jgi:hypothetical protein
MVWSFILTDADSTYTNSTTTANDYFSDWTRSFTTAVTHSKMLYTGTTYAPYTQTYTVPGTLHTGIQESYYQIVQEPYNHQEQLPQEPVHQRQPQKSAEQIKEETEATERAKTLLLEYLDEENKQKFYDKKHLEISSKLFKHVKYHIPLSKLGRIKAWKENKVISELCLLVKEAEQLPTEDVVLTKLLYVLHDERNMLKTANHSHVEENLLAGLN